MLLIFDLGNSNSRSLKCSSHYIGIQKGQQDGTGKILNVLGKLMERLVKSSIREFRPECGTLEEAL